MTWGYKEAGVNLLLYTLTKDDKYKQAFTTHMDGWANADPIKKTPAGLSYVSQWGSLRVAGTLILPSSLQFFFLYLFVWVVLTPPHSLPPSLPPFLPRSQSSFPRPHCR